MTTAAEHTGNAEGRPCVVVAIPSGPEGLELLLAPLVAALESTGPAVALVPAAGPDGVRERIVAAVAPGRPVPADVAVVAATSGSTGEPAGVLLPGSALRAAALALAAHTQVPHGHRWVAGLPLSSVGGLMVAVRALVAGCPPVAMASLGGARRFDVEGFAAATDRARALSARDGRALATSLVPAMLALLDAAGEDGHGLLAAYDLVLVGGAAAPPTLVSRLRAAGVRVRLSYGMTETCGGAVIDGRPLPGVTVTEGAGGRLRIGGAQVALGYRDGRWPERWSVAPDGSRAFTTADLGRVGPDGLVTVTGRADDVVQVGGTSVSLAAVRAAVLADARVADAEVVAVPDLTWGSRIVAFVVASPIGAGVDAGRLADELPLAVQQALGRAAAPREVHVVAGLPLLASGKVDRRALRDRAGTVAPLAPEPGGSR